jgi:hypothetical protein
LKVCILAHGLLNSSDYKQNNQTSGHPFILFEPQENVMLEMSKVFGSEMFDEFDMVTLGGSEIALEVLWRKHAEKSSALCHFERRKHAADISRGRRRFGSLGDVV